MPSLPPPSNASARTARLLYAAELLWCSGDLRGDPPVDLFVVREGTFDVFADGRLVNEVGPGEWFGEIGLVREARTRLPRRRAS